MSVWVDGCTCVCGLVVHVCSFESVCELVSVRVCVGFGVYTCVWVGGCTCVCRGGKCLCVCGLVGIRVCGV